MSIKKEPAAEEIRYIAFRDLNFSYSIAEDALFSERQAEATQYDLEIVKMLSLEDEVVRMVFTFHFRGDVGSKKEARCTYVTEHVFKPADFHSWVDKKKFTVDEDLDNMLTGIAYSTVRGALIQKFNGTWFAGFILPIVKPAELGEF